MALAAALVLGFPLVAATGYGIATYCDFVLPKDRKLVERYSQFLYVSFLAIPVIGVWLATAGDGGVPAMFKPDASDPALLIGIWLLAGAVLGSVLYAFELWGTLTLRNLPGIGSLMQHPAVEGNTETGANQIRQVAAPAAFTAVTGSTVVLEEIAWRGFLIEFLEERWGLGVAGAFVIAGVSFGLNHLYYGLRGFLFKSVHGIAWGALFVITGSLLAAIVSHFVFNVWVWKKLRKGEGTKHVGHRTTAAAN